MRGLYIPSALPEERPFLRISLTRSVPQVPFIFLGVNLSYDDCWYNGWGYEFKNGYLGDWGIWYIGQRPKRLKGQLRNIRNGGWYGYRTIDIYFDTDYHTVERRGEFDCGEVARWLCNWRLTAFLVNWEVVSIVRGRVVGEWSDYESQVKWMVDLRNRQLEVQNKRFVERKVLGWAPRVLAAKREV